MRNTPEGLVKQKVVKVLKEYDVYYFFPATGGYGRSGVPDIICCLPGGRFMAIECKAGKGMLTRLQEKEIAKIHKCGGAALVVYEGNLDTVELAIKRACDAEHYPM